MESALRGDAKGWLDFTSSRNLKHKCDSHRTSATSVTAAARHSRESRGSSSSSSGEGDDDDEQDDNYPNSEKCSSKQQQQQQQLDTSPQQTIQNHQHHCHRYRPCHHDQHRNRHCHRHRHDTIALLLTSSLPHSLSFAPSQPGFNLPRQSTILLMRTGQHHACTREGFAFIGFWWYGA